ncbi:FAD-dependent oxidoreductase [Limimaricola hongkongensis]|uniref:Xanthan lyase n=1 Tax=Limimaricola hongkongensis DSM 17492 TaxID=1122180 RepID=A0A017HCD7_9RHOB|nr:FAD-dependent oxidoreductase [Limimaricola hongkongensis]EYD71823.1 hypothetical protein Lokhon_01893 [Limimaricola hongkongensis DSM 17492]
MDVELFVYGATPASLFAAIVAARDGKSVVICAPEPGIGGMITGGLGISDAPLSFRNWDGGVVQEFTEALVARTGFDGSSFLNWNFAPSDALAAFNVLLAAEPNITLRLGETITAVSRSQVDDINGQPVGALDGRGDRIASVTTAPCTWLATPGAGDTYTATVFVDGSYNGGLMAAAGVPFRIGRDAASAFEESYAGVHSGHVTTRSYDVVDADGDLTKYGGWKPLEADGQADRRMMALGYRNCITNIAGANNLGFPAPPGYDPEDFRAEIVLAQKDTSIGLTTREHAYNPVYRTSYDDASASAAIDGYAGMTEKERQEAWLRYSSVAEMAAYPDKFATNGSDIRGVLAAEMATASDTRRHEIREQLAYRELGRLHTFQTHADVPQVVRDRFAGWGLCADEWQEDYILTPGWPSEIYERHGRRLVGQVTVDFWHAAYEVNWPDQIAVGAYFMDSKAKAQWATPFGGNAFEGHYAVQPFDDANGNPVRADTYNYVGIPLRAVVPPVGVCDNLALCWCVSASEVAFSSIRLEPFLSAVGEAVGHLACAAINTGVAPARLDYSTVRARLDAAGLTITRF